ncbi:MAG TPA: hypothetical protein PL041_08990 [Melioribacteraceae bacterium]|nr:hypothetical protein [Melioribacteraceae bacterium]
MQNREKYRFDDFTFENYTKLLNLAKTNGFTFINFDEAFDNKNRNLLWRHDVEFSPFVALKMAEAEKELQIKATYFFQLHCDFYNLLEKEIFDIAVKIKLMGHEIGLHFDAHFFGIDNEDKLDNAIKIELEYLNNLYDFNIKAFSFHNTNKFILSCEKEKYGGLINVYSKYFKDNFYYCSDSTGWWRFRRVEDVLKDDCIKNAHILTHEAMWSNEVLSPYKRIVKVLNDETERIKNNYIKSENAFGAIVVDDDRLII